MRRQLKNSPLSVPYLNKLGATLLPTTTRPQSVPDSQKSLNCCMRVIPSVLGLVVCLGITKTGTSLFFRSPIKSSLLSSHLFNRISLRNMSTSLNDSKINEYKAAAAEEIVEIVDEDNNILTPCKRSEMRANRLIHRATYAFVKDSQNYFYVQVRLSLLSY